MRQCEIEKELRGDALRLSWDNRCMPVKTRVFVVLTVFWVVWAPITVYNTWELFHEFSIGLALWLIFGWLGTLFIPLRLIGRFRGEWIEVSPEAVSFGGTGWWARKPKRLPLERIREIAIGHYGDAPEQETMLTLNVFTQGPWYSDRHMIGYWLADQLKWEVFEMIRDFVAEKGIAVKVSQTAPDVAPNVGTRGNL